jgi:hypothetical protein
MFRHFNLALHSVQLHKRAVGKNAAANGGGGRENDRHRNLIYPLQ